MAILILSNYLLWTAVGEANIQNLRVIFLDVGQGDAILVRTPTGENILVDGGPDDSVIAELGKYLPVWDRELDLVVATHHDADHITGLIRVLRDYKVKEVLTLAIPSVKQINSDWEALLKQAPLVNWADVNDDYQWGEVSWDTLWPILSTPENYQGNNSSIVGELSFHNSQILLTGDIEAKTESAIQELYPGLGIDILKVAHHGSRFSSNTGFLQAISAQVAVIPVGKNSYGHPTSEVLDRLQTARVDIYRTDRDDTIEVIVGNNGYFVKANGKEKFYTG